MTRLRPEGEPVEIQGDGEAPAGFTWRGTFHPIDVTCNCWRIHTRWWEPGKAVCREYLKVTTKTGLLCLLYRDLIGEGWFLARIYD